jgi:hypothetical protein
LVVVAAMNRVIGGLIAAALIGRRLPVAGSFVLGASSMALGMFFSAVALATSQVTENSHVASGLAGAVLGVAFMLRALGDIADGRLSWLSPIGWSQKSRPFAGDLSGWRARSGAPSHLAFGAPRFCHRRLDQNRKPSDGHRGVRSRRVGIFTSVSACLGIALSDVTDLLSTAMAVPGNSARMTDVRSSKRLRRRAQRTIDTQSRSGSDPPWGDLQAIAGNRAEAPGLFFGYEGPTPCNPGTAGRARP